jgi:tetratricopeptide (TPR) repeat protein
MLRRAPRIWLAGVLLLALPLAASDERLARARRLLDEGRPVAAAEELAPVLRKDPDHAEALLLRSTARFMEGLSEEGRADLERALASDPTLRQAWLNRAGLDIAEERYEAALAALERARALDPEASDNHLNLGAVMLLLGRLEEATGHFDRYLETAGALPAAGALAEAHYLVATNYAGRGYAGPAVAHLRRAVELDESRRLAARTDPNFLAVAEAPDFRRLLETDLHPPGADDRSLRRSFPVPYAGGEGQLLSAVLEALRLIGEPFDPRVEVTPGWALVHGELRIKVYDPEPGGAEGGEGAVEISAPAAAVGPGDWQRRVDRLLESVELALLRRGRVERPAPEPPPGR